MLKNKFQWQVAAAQRLTVLQHFQKRDNLRQLFRILNFLYELNRNEKQNSYRFFSAQVNHEM